MNNKLENSNFRNVHFIDGDAKYICYRTGLTVYEETFKHGRFMSAGWNTAGYMLNVLDDMPTRLDNDSFSEPQAFDLEADGVSLSWDWEFAGIEQVEEIAEKTEAPLTHVTVTLKSTVKELTAKVHTVLDGTPIFTRWIEVINDSEKPMNINCAAPMSGGIEVVDGWKEYMKGAPNRNKVYSLGYMDQSTWGHEGYFKWQDLPVAEYAFGGKYMSQRHRQPFFALRNNLLGTIMIAQMGWSGGFKFSFNNDQDMRVSFKMEMASQKPIIILSPKEAFETPKIHIGMISGDLDDAVNSMHRHIRRSVFTAPDVQGVLGWVEGGMGPERIMDVKATKHFVDTIAAVGGETMIIDAGWFCPLGTAVNEWWHRTGDWYPDAERYPNGIEEIRDYAHSKGLKFGLWMDIERLGPTSKAYKEHPEWLSKQYNKEETNTQINMADPEAAAWVEAELIRVIEEYKCDLFRLDYNLGSIGQLLNRYDNGYGTENAYVRYYQNTNAMYHRLKRRFPDVIFENCAGGGGRTDVEFVSNFTHTWVSDWNVAPRSLAITNGMTMVLPPEVVDRLLSGMNCHTRASLDFQVRNTIFGRPTTNDYNCVGSEMNPDQLALVKHTFDIYKEHIRPYIPESKYFHHTPELIWGHNGAEYAVEHPQGSAILERASGDCKHGVIGLFKLADANDEEYLTVFPRGTDPSMKYEVTFDNSGAKTEISGFEMINNGIKVRLPGSLTSELIIYEAK